MKCEVVYLKGNSRVADRDRDKLVIAAAAHTLRFHFSHSPRIALLLSLSSHGLLSLSSAYRDKLVIAGDTVRIDAAGVLGSVTRWLSSQGTRECVCVCEGEGEGGSVSEREKERERERERERQRDRQAVLSR
jgi:hypothetical protein